VRFRLRDFYPLWCEFPFASTNARLCNFPTRRQTDQDESYNPRATTAAAYHITRVWPDVFAYGTVTRCGATFQSLRLTPDFVTSRPAGRRIKTGPTTPTRQRLPPITSYRSARDSDAHLLGIPGSRRTCKRLSLPSRCLRGFPLLSIEAGSGRRTDPLTRCYQHCNTRAAWLSGRASSPPRPVRGGGFACHLRP
jgi:hypothetical protein